MKANSYTPRSAWRIALIAATLTVGACDAVNEIVNRVDDADVRYYVSLGTSLSVGVQPNGSGIPLPTNDGYADQLFDSIKLEFDTGETQARDLKLVKLGCPGETLADMVDGGSCPYIAGSQLNAALAFLTDNGDKVHLVTIDIGGNDFRNADCIGATSPPLCADVSAQIANDLVPVLAALRLAADPNTTIVGMNYYNPYLSSWLDGGVGETLAMDSVAAVRELNDFLDATYTNALMPVADVAAAFQSDELFSTMVPYSQPPPDMVPLSVANICTFTYQCDPDRGPDIHANTAGYSLIAVAFEDALAALP